MKTIMKVVTWIWFSLTQASRPPSNKNLITLRRPQRGHIAKWSELRHHIGDTVVDGVKEPVYLTMSALNTHMNVLGRTGRGKSSLMRLLIRDYLHHGMGFLLCDPKGTAVDDVLADISALIKRTKSRAILRRVILIEISPDSVTSISILRWTDHGKEVTNWDAAMRSFFAKRADVIIAILSRVLGEDESGAPRIKRILRAVLQAVGLAGLDLVDCVTLIDPFAKRHTEVWEACKATRQLPPEVESDLEAVHSMPSLQEAFRQVEGPINRLRQILSILMQAVFREAVHSVNIDNAVRLRMMILLYCRETPYVSRSQTMSLIAVVLHSVIEARFSQSDRELASQPPYPILCDEAADFFGDDCERVLRKGRSLKMPLLLFTQNFSAYKHKEADHTESVANECGITICFQYKTPPPEILNILLHGRLNLTQATRVAFHPDGYDFVLLPSLSRSRRRSLGYSETRGESRASARTITASEGQTSDSSVSNGLEFNESQRQSIDLSRSQSNERSIRRSKSRSHDQSVEHSSSESDEHRTGHSTGFDETRGSRHGHRHAVSHQSGNSERIGSTEREVSERGYNRNDDGSTTGYGRYGETAAHDTSNERSNSSSTSTDESHETLSSTTNRRSETSETAHRLTHGTSNRRSTSVATGNDTGIANRSDQGIRLTQANGTGKSASHERSIRNGKSSSRSVALQTGGSRSRTLGITVGEDEGETHGLSVSPLARHKRVEETLPQLEVGLDVQRENLARELSTLGVAEVLLRDDTNCKTIRVQIREVVSPFETDEEHFGAIEEVKAMLRDMHPFMNPPDVSPQAEQRRIDKHLHRLRQMRYESGESDVQTTEPDEPNDQPFH